MECLHNIRIHITRTVDHKIVSRGLAIATADTIIYASPRPHHFSCTHFPIYIHIFTLYGVRAKHNCHFALLVCLVFVDDVYIQNHDSVRQVRANSVLSFYITLSTKLKIPAESKKLKLCTHNVILCEFNIQISNHDVIHFNHKN